MSLLREVVGSRRVAGARASQSDRWLGFDPRRGQASRYRATPRRLVPAALGVAGLAAYAWLALVLDRRLTTSVAPISLLPVALIAAGSGLRAGAGSCAVLFVVHVVSALASWPSYAFLEALLNDAVLLAAGLIVAYVSDRGAQTMEARTVDREALARERQGRQGAEEALRARDEDAHRYHLLAEASPAALCLMTLEGSFIEVNDALALLGYEREELLAMHVSELYAHEPDWAWSLEVLEDHPEAAAEGLEVLLRKKDGSELLCVTSQSLWHDDTGRSGYRAVITDVERQRRAEATMRDTEQRLELAMESAHMALWDMDLETRRVSPGDTFASLFHLGPRSAVDDHEALLRLIHQDDRVAFERAVDRAIERRGDFELELRVLLPDGSMRWMAARGRVVAPDRWRSARLAGTFVDISDRKKQEAQVEHLGFYDPLTDLPNRRLLKSRVYAALAQARQDHKMVAVLFLDLDRFKVINDTLGHTAGDRLLQEVAERLAGSVRSYDTVARQGGDEFMVLVPGIEQVEEAEKVAQRIQTAVEDPFYIAGRKLHVTTSIGISVYPQDGDGAEPLLRNADAAMYRVKESGRNGYQFHTSAMYAAAFGRLELEAALRNALDRNELVVFYQPVLAVNSGEIIGAEALVRWATPSGELLSPAEFIPLAEESGLIVPLGLSVLRAVCEQGRRWRDDGLRPLRLAVNVAAHQFEQANLAGVLAKILRETGFESRWLQLEITETTAMFDVDHTKRVLGELRDIGVEAALDDFGTGHASLNYLKDFPLRSLKIDRSFVAGLTNNKQNQALATGIIGLGHALDLEVIAEGVEQMGELRFLRSRDCDAFQGFLFSRAVPAEEFESLVQRPARLVIPPEPQALDVSVA